MIIVPLRSGIDKDHHHSIILVDMIKSRVNFVIYFMF